MLLRAAGRVLSHTWARLGAAAGRGGSVLLSELTRARSLFPMSHCLIFNSKNCIRFLGFYYPTV